MKKLLRFAPWVAALLISCFGSYFVARAVAPSGPTTFQALRLIPAGQPFGLSLENPIGHALQVLDNMGNPYGFFIASAYQGTDACEQLTNAFNAANAAGGGVIVASYAKPQTCANQIQDLNAQSVTVVLNGTIKSTTPFSTGLVYITPVSRTVGVQIVGAVPVSMYGIAYNPAAATIDYEPTSGSQPIINYNGGTTNGGTQSGLKNLQLLGNSAVTSGYYYRALTGTDFQIENVAGYSTTSIPTGAVIDIASAATSGGNWDFPHISGIATGNWATALSFNASVGNSENGNLSNVFCNNSTATGPCATLSNIFGWSIKRISARAGSNFFKGCIASIVE